MVRLSACDSNSRKSFSHRKKFGVLLASCLAVATSVAIPTARADESNALQTLEYSAAVPLAISEIASTPATEARPVLGTVGEPILAEKSEEAKAGRFHKALRERDFSVGYGRKIPSSRFDGRTDVELIQLIPRWGRFRNANQEFLWEVPITYATSPDNAYAAGLTLMFRQHLSSRRSFAPFVEIGAGIVFTNFDKKFPELGGSFQFTPQAGIGFRKSISKSGDLVAAARWFHMSNAGTRSPNAGLNNYLVTLGYSKLF